MNRVITDAESVEALAAEWPDQRPVSLPERLDDEADLCANEGADDIAGLLSEAATELRALAGRVAELEAERDKLQTAAMLVLAWYEAEENHGDTTFMQRVEMCRESEDALRAALSATTPESKP